MKVLVVGAGGREHALAWKIARSPLVREVLCAPGNAGAAEVARLVPAKPDDVPALLAIAQAERVDLVVIGPDAALAAGLADALLDAGIPAFGPSRAAARLESSKAFAKEFMVRHAIPTARHAVFERAGEAKAHLYALDPPYVIKADGLAAGKGVAIRATREEAAAEIDLMLGGKFGEASRRIVIEEFLHGEEASVFALTDGVRFALLPPCQDHKRRDDGDKGPNTGGMGACAPAPAVTRAILAQVSERIIAPTLRGMAEEGAPFRGCLYVGLMLTADGPRVVEFNARFGDPECQTLMPILEAGGVDLAPALRACAAGALAPRDFVLAADPRARAAATVVLATRGYPGAVETGSLIGGIERAARAPGVTVFHAGTTRDAEGRLRAAAGRVLNITATGADIAEAVARAYEGVSRIDWPEGFWRRDIGARVLGRPASGTGERTS